MSGWLRALRHRIWPGRWTQAEIDDIHRRAHERWQALQPFLDTDPEAKK